MPVRLKAALIHLLSSVLIFGIVIGAMTSIWYPWPYYEINGLFQGLRITAGVDLILGPSLTLLLFNQKKTRRALQLDLTLVAVIQLIALSYGVFTIYEQRPYVAVLLDGRISTQHRYDLPDGPAQARASALISANPQRPAILAVRPAKDGEEFASMLAAEFTATGFPPEFVERLEPVSAHWDENRKSALSMPQHLPKNAEAVFDDFLQQKKLKREDVTFLEVAGPFGGCMAAFLQKNGDFLGYVDIDPTSYSRAALAPKKKK